MFKSAETKTFFAAWDALRSEISIPHYRIVFERLSSELIPQLLILEEADRDYVVRFMGTQIVDIWGEDLTGASYLAHVRSKQVASMRELLSEVVNRPCGLLTRSYVADPPRSDLDVESIFLPAANDPGRPRRLLVYGRSIQRGVFLTGSQKLFMIEHDWIDVGYGLPKTANS